MCGVIVVDVELFWSTNLGCGAYIHDHFLGYRHNYLMFYQLPNSNLFTHRLLFFSREATSETYGHGSYFSYICLCDLLFPCFYFFRSIKPKIQKYFAALYFICDLFIQSITTFSRPRISLRRRYPKGIDNPFNTSGCGWLLFVCRGCLRCVAWFSYLFDTLVS